MYRMDIVRDNTNFASLGRQALDDTEVSHVTCGLFDLTI